MRVLFLAGGTQEPSSRFRAHQFFPHFEARGVQCVSRTAYGDGYHRWNATPLAGGYKLACRLKRGLQTLTATGFDLVFLQRTALPQTAWFEKAAARQGAKLIFDFDDSIFLGPTGEPDRHRERAFTDAVRVSRHVIAGNRFLAERAAAPEKTTVIPTVIDTDRFRPGEEGGDPERVVIGWMGTAGNFGFFPEIAPVIRRLLAEDPRLRFRIVSDAAYPELAGHPGVEQIRWSAKDEVRQLQSFDVGLMPLVDTPWTRGKCGFKLIQYMAVGRPVVASAVGANVEIVSPSGGGYLVTRPEEWHARLRELIADAELRRRMGAAAREHAVRHYSVRSVVDTHLDLFRQVAGER